MKVAFVQTYPVYHDMNMSSSDWLAIEDRDKWMPSILAAEGHEVELWAISRETSVHQYMRDPFGTVTIRLFKASTQHKRTKRDYSDELVNFAHVFNADLHILKGVDGGAGLRLLDRFLLPRQKPYVFVIGGKFYNKYVPKAAAVFYETSAQKQKLRHRGWNLSRKKIPEEKLFFLPKSIDTEHFRPIPSVEKEFDIISAGRLIPRYKDYSALGQLSKTLDVALIGGGPKLQELKSLYPDLHLFGYVPHKAMPQHLNRGKVFFHTGLYDFFPRVLPEAMATGLPGIAFREVILEEIIPGDAGLRVGQEDYVTPIVSLLKNSNGQHIDKLAANAREHVVRNFGIDSSRQPMWDMLGYLESKL